MKRRSMLVLFVMSLIGCVAAAIALHPSAWGTVAMFLAATLLCGVGGVVEDDFAEEGDPRGIITRKRARAVAWTIRAIGATAVIVTAAVLWVARSN